MSSSLKSKKGSRRRYIHALKRQETFVYTFTKGGRTCRAISEGPSGEERTPHANPNVPRQYVSIHTHLHPILPSLPFSEAKNHNATIRSRFPHERITPIFRPINVEFQIQRSPTDSPRVGPAGGYHPSPSQKFPETFGALIKIPLHESATLMREYGLEAAISDKKVPEEARLDNLNKLMLHFGVSSPPPAPPEPAHLFLMPRSVIGCTRDR
jgi:hypothetical protein